MNWFALLALGLAVTLAPAPPTADARRAAALAGVGRLAAVARPRRSRRLALPTRGLVGCAGVAVAVGVAASAGVALGIAAATVGATIASLVGGGLARRRRTVRAESLIAAVRMLTAELAAGGRPAAALAGAAAMSGEHSAAFTAAADAAGAGDGGDAVATALSARHSDLRPVAHAWRVAAACGAPLAEILGRVAADLAAGQAQRRTVAVALAGPASSAALLATLPVLGILLGVAMGASPARTLFGTGWGQLLCCVGVLLDAVGVLWTRRLMRSAET